MPYAQLTDEDIEALYEYFMTDVKPVETRPPAMELPFPFNIRLSMAAWNLLFVDSGSYKPDPAHDFMWNRGPV